MSSSGRNRDNQNFWNTQNQQQNAAIAQISPQEQAERDRISSIQAWENAPGHDIRDLPGMGDFVQIGQAALQRANADKKGTGALQLADGGSSGYAQQLKELKRNELGQEVGAGLENARAQIIGQAHGEVLPMAQLGLSRSLGQAGHSAQMFGMWNQRPSRNWWDYLREGVQMAANPGGFGTSG
jgi:hypothetical protein